MKQSTLPPHLPQPPRNRAHYESLYRYGYGGGAGDENAVWHERRIPANLSAANVYRMLPSASDFEYGGYLTKTRIRYVVGAPESVSPPCDLPCVFHSHPFAHPYADAPSPLDIYQFIKCECLRAVTVGNRWIWVWNKNRRTVKTVQKFLEWEMEHMVREILRLMDAGVAHAIHRYIEFAIRQLGFRCPRRQLKDPTSWAPQLSESIGIRSTLIRRSA